MKATTLTPSEASEFVETCFKLKMVPYLGGPPGIGKSQIVMQVADRLNLQVIDVRLSSYLAEDMSGIPFRNEETMKAEYVPFSRIPLKEDDKGVKNSSLPEGKVGWVLFLDEFSSASEEVWAASYALLLDRTIGGKDIHPRCLIASAGNLETNSAIARKLPQTLLSRVQPALIETSIDDWQNWFKKQKTYDPKLEVFLDSNDTLFNEIVNANTEMDELEVKGTPRGWEKVANILAMHTPKKNSQEPNDISNISFRMISSAVGTDNARIFREFYCKPRTTINIYDIVTSPYTVVIPDNYTLADYDDLLNAVLEKYTNAEESRENIRYFLNRLSTEYREQFIHIYKYKCAEDGVFTNIDSNKIKEEVNILKRYLGIDE